MSVTVLEGDDSAKLEAQRALLAGLEIKAGQLKPLTLDTPIVQGGQARAVICHADDPAWREAASIVEEAIRDVTGVALEMKTDKELAPEQIDAQNVILLGHLDNNRYVARLYHGFLVCLDVGYTGRSGYVIRSVHDPFGAGHNAILVGGSFADGAKKAAEAFADLVKRKGSKGALTLGRLLVLKFDPQDRIAPPPKPMTEQECQNAIENGRRLMFSPGQGRGGAGRLIDHGTAYHRTGDPLQGKAYREMMLALLDYYRTDKYINSEGMTRYDNDFRDAWTYEVAILWDLIEESGLFSDKERLDMTNLIVRLGLECVLYQGWNRPDSIERWAKNQDIVHNHNTFPALGVLFVGNYMKRHYKATFVDDWLKVAHGIFNGQKHSSKPQEDAAGYQWLPLLHTMIYSLSQGDLTFFEEGHARESAKVALMVMDNAGYQAAFGDYPAYKVSNGLGATLGMIGWFHKDPELLWGARHAAGTSSYPLDQTYASAVTPRVPMEHVGLTVARLPRQAYDHVSRGSQYRTTPNLPFEQTFDKLAFRGGWEKRDGYMLLDGFGRGNHMHFDANAIISYAGGGEPLLVDGEYIKNAPKYHNSIVIIRDGQAEFTPAVTGLGRADYLDSAAYSRTWLTQYNGVDWTRSIVWRPNDYVLVSDEVRALHPGNYTLRCCWRPWGDASLAGGVLTVSHPPMRLVLCNADGASSRLETMKVVDRMPVSRWSQQVGLPLKQGETYRFLNLFHAEPSERARAVAIRRVGEGLVVVERPDGSDVVAFGAGVGALHGLQSDAEMALLAPDRLIVAGCTSLKDAQDVLSASAPVSLELVPGSGAGVLLASAETNVKLRIKPDGRLTWGDSSATADRAGHVTFKLPAGRHTLRFDGFPMYPAVLDAATQVPKLPIAENMQRGKGLDTSSLKLLWEAAGLDPMPRPLPVVRVRSSEPHTGRYGPVEKLFDGEYNGSQASVMWAPGVAPVITAELAEESEIHSVVLREWHMNATWDIGDRKLEISSDGFNKDVRAIPGPFADAGQESFGSNINSLMEAKVGQKARQVRLTLAPTRADSSVYLAEVEIRGVRSDAIAEIHAHAVGDLDGDGRAELVVAGAFGQIRAFTADGKPLWTFTMPDHATVNALACADVDGDGKAEVLYGADAAQLGLLSGDGKERWKASPPKFRGIGSDVMTVFPADVNGDGRPEIVCGCASWQYFAYDAEGKMIWQNVIYAHSATFGCAGDIDGDGKDEIVAGNTYYRLNAIDHTGERLWNVGNIGPEMTAVACADVNGDRLPEVLTGVDGGDVHCYDGKGKELWQTNLGDKVTRILPVDLNGDGVREIVCSAESAHVFALRGDGSLLWKAALPDGVSDLTVLVSAGKPLLIAAAGAAGLVGLDATGAVVAQGGHRDSMLYCRPVRRHPLRYGHAADQFGF